MKHTTRLAKRAILFGILSVAMGSVAGQGMPKEGRFDITSCSSAASNVIAFSKTHFAYTVEVTGTTRSNPAGGMFDMSAFRCVGMTTSIEGKAPFNTVCETIDRDGDKHLSQYFGEGRKFTGEAILAGTGKYEGMITTGDVENLGPFPTIKPGTSQNCIRQTGTYKLK